MWILAGDYDEEKNDDLEYAQGLGRNISSDLKRDVKHVRS